MKINEEIVLIDNDEFERDFFKEILTELDLSIELKQFRTPEKGLEYLAVATHKIFVVISLIDFGRGIMTGLEMKKKINEHTDLMLKTIPFVFMTYLHDIETIEEAYKLNIQGYFKKPMTLEGSTKLISTLFSYWALNLRPDEVIIPDSVINKIVK